MHCRAALRALAVMVAMVAMFPSSGGCRQSGPKGPVYQPAVAGAFYPAEPSELASMVDGYLANVKNTPSSSGRLMALVSPHAGYVYSGQVAAHGYQRLKGSKFDTVIIIGSSHRESYNGAAVIQEGRLKTPLGEVEIDSALARSFINEKAGVRHYPKAFEKEHSLEVQLPFLQRALAPGFKVVPVLIGQPTDAMFEHLAARLADAMRKNGVLVVASTDLSHYHDDATARTMDKKIADALSRLSVRECGRLVFSGEAEMCGSIGVMAVVEAARRSGATRAEVFNYANSGDKTGDRGRVVGYLSAGVYSDSLTEADRRELLSMARAAIVGHVKNGTAPEIKVLNPKFLADGAVFVTINRQGRLRGCIGDVIARQPLYRSVLGNAVRACSMDPRFPPMTTPELSDMELEISILSHLTPVEDVSRIEVGKHGLMLVKGNNSGLLLPQVPLEWGWDRETFLDQLANKAGLPKGAWREGAAIYSFTADVFHEQPAPSSPK